PGPMSTVVHEEQVPRLSRSHKIREGKADVLAGRLSVGVVGVDQDGDVVFRETIAIEEAAVSPPDIVDTTLEFGLGAGVVAAYQHRLLCHVVTNVLDRGMSLFSPLTFRW